MKILNIEVYIRSCYYMTGSIILAPLAIIPLLLIQATKDDHFRYLHSHFTWLKKAFIQTVPAAFVIYFFMQILTFIFDNVWIELFGNDFISMLLGAGIIPLAEILIVFITFGKIYPDIKKGLKLLEEKKEYPLLSK